MTIIGRVRFWDEMMAGSRFDAQTILAKREPSARKYTCMTRVRRRYAKTNTYVPFICW